MRRMQISLSSTTHLFVYGIFPNHFVLMLGEEHVGALEALWCPWGFLEFDLVRFFCHVVCVWTSEAFGKGCSVKIVNQSGRHPKGDGC